MVPTDDVPTDDVTTTGAVPSAPDQAEDQVEPFRRLADAIPHVFWITQLNPERVIYVSPSFESIWGRTAQELYDDPRVWTACIHPEDRAEVEAKFVEWITGQDRTAKKLEYRVVQPSGALRWITDCGVVTYDRENRPVRVSGVCTDITELKLAEREHLSHLWFLESLDRVNQIIQGTNDLEQMMSAVLDEVRRIFRCDRALLSSPLDPGAAELWAELGDGHEVTRFGQDSKLEVPAELASGFGVRSVLCTALSSKVGTKYLFQLQQCDHARSWSREEDQLLREIGRRLADAISTLWTVRQQKRAEQLFVTQHAVTRLLAEAPELVDAAPRILKVICESLAWDLGVLWQWDAQQPGLHCAELWQRTPCLDSRFGAWLEHARFQLDQDPVGVVWSERKPAFTSDLGEHDGSAWAMAAAEDGLHATFAFPVPAGTEMWGVMQFFSHDVRERDLDLLATMATLGSQIGQFVERKQAETALQNARDQLAHVTRVASLGEMTASIAHEVNQPLTGIIANAHAALRWLSREPPALQEALDSIQRLARDGRRAGDVITRLKTLIRQGDTRTKTQMDVNLVVRETLPLVRSEIQQNRVELELELGTDLPPVIGDRVQLQQVLLNLISNALEAMSSVEQRPCRLTIRSSDPGGDTVLVSVCDTGVGLHPEGMSKIFDAFFTTKPQGMGMGLAISRSIVEDHGGRLSATSRPGEGSTFQFTLQKAAGEV
jgi:PAS domain S-box-containing protein